MLGSRLVRFQIKVCSSDFSLDTVLAESFLQMAESRTRSSLAAIRRGDVSVMPKAYFSVYPSVLLESHDIDDRLRVLRENGMDCLFRISYGENR